MDRKTLDFLLDLGVPRQTWHADGNIVVDAQGRTVAMAETPEAAAFIAAANPAAVAEMATCLKDAFPKWTREFPTKPGLYWFSNMVKTGRLEITEADIAERRDGNENWGTSWEWAGPIPEPVRS